MINKVQSITNCYWFGAEEVYYYLFKVFISLVFVSTKDMSVNYFLDDGQWPLVASLSVLSLGLCGRCWLVLVMSGRQWAGEPGQAQVPGVPGTASTGPGLALLTSPAPM